MRSSAGAGAALNLKFEHAVSSCSALQHMLFPFRLNVAFLSAVSFWPLTPFPFADHVAVSSLAWVPFKLLRP